MIVTPVHPRGRGEHSTGRVKSVWRRGSSPRARGTRQMIFDFKIVFRFIPAGAGNTRSVPKSTMAQPVHPRGRGEHAT